MALHYAACLTASSNDIFNEQLGLGEGFNPTIAELVLMFASMTGLNFNFHNIVTGVVESADPT